ncbi:MAG: hypothetical protein A2289_18000 [Deltaproteobacteria bacterium RIFOXYA12_FULL_58_15]|nr:MAG: hypothetical protein A2289_18000 [Deltaproteobacteria bacterium RIFOXYA12_FULL_58_15]OGR07093.1 MAG: hypothetical protein A2341_08130 [Deltaproteobacteria bacterium RIFOXYB12_FULL_58_9]
MIDACCKIAFSVALFVTSACGGGRIHAGPTTAKEGIRVELLNARVTNERVVLELRVTSPAEADLTIVPARFVLVGPDGDELSNSWTADGVMTVPKGNTQCVDFEYDHAVADLERAPGFWLRLDGFTLGHQSVEMSPMPIGHPLVPEPSES